MSRVRFAAVGLVAAGGVIGTALREGLALSVPDVDGFPLIVAVINVVGAFVLGGLLGLLPGRPTERSERLRLFFGVGVLGGFTTYSALAADTAEFLLAGDIVRAVAYAAGSVVLGLGAALCGIVAAARLRGRR